MASNHEAEIHTYQVLIEVGKKRAHQRYKGYTPEHDDQQGIGHLLDVMDTRLDENLRASSNIREELVHQAAIIVAIIETIDRNKEIK